MGRKRFILILMAALALGLALVCPAAAEEEARELKITASQKGLSWDGVSKRSYYAENELNLKQTLTLEANADGEKIYALYLVWAKAPGSWTLEYGQQSAACGGNGYLHEFVPVEGGAESVRITVENPEKLCFIRAFGPGALPQDVQVWEPACDQADILLLPAHADDEILFFGSILAEYGGEKNLAVQVAYFSTYPYGIREHEKLDGLWTCGVRAYPVNGGFADAPMETPEQARQYFGGEKATAYYVELLRRFRPQVVIGHDIHGEYGHGTHRFISQILQESVEISPDGNQYPESAQRYGAWDVPKTYLHLWKENPIRLDCRKPLEAFDGQTAMEVVEAAYKKHVTQQIYWFQVSDSNAYSMAEFGLYRTTVGLDTGSDIMEHLVSYEEQAQLERERLEQERLEQERLAAEQKAREEEQACPVVPIQATEPTAPAESEQKRTVLPIALAAAGLGLLGGMLLVIRKRR